MSNLLIRKSQYFPVPDENSFSDINSYYSLSHLRDNCNYEGTHFTRNNSQTRLTLRQTAIKYDHAKSRYNYKLSDINVSTDPKKIEQSFSIRKKTSIVNFDPFLNKENFHSKLKVSETDIKQNEELNELYGSLYSQASLMNKFDFMNFKENENFGKMQKLKENLKDSLKEYNIKENFNQNIKLSNNFNSKVSNNFNLDFNRDKEFIDKENMDDSLIGNKLTSSGSKLYVKKINKVFDRVKNMDYKHKIKNNKFVF
jgi:hypothetical protein